MNKSIHRYLSVILSLFISFSASFTPIMAEGEDNPEPTGETTSEVMVEADTGEETEIPEAAEEEQSGEEKENLEEKEEEQDENDEVPAYEENQLTEDYTDAIVPEEEGEDNEIFETSDSNFTYTINDNGTVTINKYTGSDTIVEIPAKIEDYPVAHIGDYAFDSESNIIRVTIPDGVKSIGKRAFYLCSSLASITFPDSLRTIKESAFQNCTSLTSVMIPDNVESIGGSAFSGCGSLTRVSFPNNVTNILGGTFSDCTNLTTITIPDSVTSIGNGVFSNCSSLTHISIPDSVTSIGNYAFRECKNLTDITLSNSLTSINEYTFSGCSSLTHVSIPDSVTSLERDAFSRCVNLSDIKLSNSLKTIGRDAFYSCRNLADVIIPNNVTTIGNGAFDGCSSLTNITIPDSVTSIGGGAFADCSNLTGITIPANVAYIEGSLFNGSNSLSTIVVDSANPYFDSRDNCNAIISSENGVLIAGCGHTIIPSGISGIGREAFGGCLSLTSITIPEGVTSIGEYAFSNCSSLTNVTISEGLTSIEDFAFSDCSSLTSIALPKGLTSIGSCAFSNCSSLTSVTIPDSTTNINYDAFDKCTNLQDVYYAGSQSDWDNITIDIGNYYLLHAAFHFNHTEHDPVAESLTPVNELTEEDVFFNKYEYQLFDNALSWEEAEKYCESIGGHLAVITSSKEQDAVNSLLNKGNKEYYWVGAEAGSNGLTYNWINGDYLKYHNWKNDTVTDEHYIENGAVTVLGINTGSKGKWDAADPAFYENNKDRFGFICQMGPIGKVTDSNSVTVQDFYGEQSMYLYNNRLFQYYNNNMLGYFTDSFTHMTLDDPNCPNLFDGFYWKNYWVPAYKWSAGNLGTFEHMRFTLQSLTGMDFSDAAYTSEERVLDEMTLSLVQAVIDNDYSNDNNYGVAYADIIKNNVVKRTYQNNYQYLKPLVDLLFEYKSTEQVDVIIEFFKALPVFSDLGDEKIRSLVTNLLQLENNHDVIQITKTFTGAAATLVNFVDILVSWAVIYDLQYEMIACMKSYYPSGSVLSQGLDNLERSIKNANYLSILMMTLKDPVFIKMLEDLCGKQVSTVVNGLGEMLGSGSNYGLYISLGKDFWKTITYFIPSATFDDYVKANLARSIAVETWHQLQSERADIVISHQNGNDLNSPDQIAKDKFLHTIHIAAMNNAVKVYKGFLTKNKNDTKAINYAEKINLLQKAFNTNEIQLNYDAFIQMCVNDYNNPNLNYYYGVDQAEASSMQSLVSEDIQDEHPKQSDINSDLEGTEETEERIFIDGFASYANGSDVSGLLTIPSYIDGKEVTDIGARAFVNNDDITAVYIPGVIKTIGAYSFYNCTNLKFVMIEEGVEEIDSTAFASCKNLIYVNVPASVTTLGNGIFDDCGENLLIDVTEGTQSQGLSEIYSGNTEVTLRKAVSISINSYPYQTELNLMDELNTDGLSVLVTYNTGEMLILYDGFSADLEDRKPGTNTVNVYYEGLSAQYNVEILDNTCAFTVNYLDEFNHEIADKYYGTAAYGSTIQLPYPSIEGYTVDEESLTASINHNETYTVRYTFDKIDLARAVFELEDEYVYYGEPVNPDIEVFDGDNKLVEYEDYFSWSSDNDRGGIGTIHVIGVGKYTNEIEKQFSIILPSGLWISVEAQENYIYTGKPLKPSIKVYDIESLLTPGTDYTVTYKNTTKAYHVADPENPTVTDKKKAPQIIIKSNSKGNYKGTKTIYFSIDPLNINDEQITVDELSVQAGTKPLSPVPVVYFNGKKLKNKTDYTVDYNGWDQTTSGNVTIKIHGKGNFQGTRDVTVHVASSELVSVAKLKVTSKTLKYADLNGDNFEEEIASAVTVKNGKTAVPEDAYFFEDIPEDYKKVGTVSFTLTGKEDKGYYGKKTVTVKITGIALSDKKVKAKTGLSYPYTGEAITFTPETHLVSYNGIDLTEGEDYVIDSYSKNLNAGTATVILKGINNYTGTKKVNFKIMPVTDPVEDNRIHIAEVYYSKGGSKPEVVIDGMTVNTDYTLKYTKNTKADTEGTVTVTFKGNYKGTPAKQMNFYINPKDIAEVTVISKDKVYSTKANAWKSVPVLTDTDGKKLKAGVDYEKEIGYSAADGSSLTESVAAGKVIIVTVTGKGNYTGKAEAYYRILETGKDISKAVFKIANQEYTGSEILITDMSQFTETNGLKNAYITVNKQKEYLVLGEHFEVVPGSYIKNINKGTAKVTFRGINEYGGTKTVSFKIGQRSIIDYWQGVKDFFARIF